MNGAMSGSATISWSSARANYTLSECFAVIEVKELTAKGVI